MYYRKTYYYKVLKNESLFLYSPAMDSLEKALWWYENKGKWLAKEFNRKLVLDVVDTYIEKDVREIKCNNR